MSLDEVKNFTHGRFDDDEIEKVRNLENLLGVQYINPFGTNDKNVFEKKLEECNLSSLQALAQKAGIFPGHNKERLKDQLRNEFRRITRGQTSFPIAMEDNLMDPDHPDHEKIKKILNP